MQLRAILRVLLVAAAASLWATAQTQSGPVRGRVTGRIDENRRVRLAGQVHPLARAAFDRGPAPAGLPMEHIVLLLKRSPDQQQELDRLLEDLHDAGSPQYQKWLTPDEFGQRFGVSDDDLQTVTSWLTANGFQIDNIAKARNTVEFSGTAGHVRRAFGSAIRQYVVNGEAHWANADEPTIPAALAPVVEGFVSLNDFHSAPQISTVDGPTPAGVPTPLMNFGGGLHALSPADFATIYNIKPLYQASVNGACATIAVLGRSNINIQDIVDFRGFFGLAANPPQVVVNGTDPGIVSKGEQMEATLDTTWAGAVAPNAAVKLVVSKSTNTTDGIFLSERYVINNNLADIITQSFGACESQNSGAASAISSLAQQAAAQGITFLVSSGDSGSAGCDDPNATTAQYGTSVNLMASTPYTIAVGGAQFNDSSNPSAYWSSANGAGYGSALSYIPESVWNQSCAAGSPGCTTANIWAGGGGASILFAKPSWQAGVAGIPADGRRDVPDVSLTASSHDPYVVCMNGSCKSSQFYLVSGTSAAAPAFAGIMALARQRAGARLGLVNPTLYRLAATQSAAQCDASGAPAASCIFNDVTAGNNAVPGEAGYGTASATYPAGTGFDLATGLGSVNAYNLVSAWGAVPSIQSTVTTLSVSPATIPTGATATVTITVAPKSGTGTPAGSVSLISSTGATLGSFTLSGGAVTATVGNWPAGTYTVIARYAGSPTFAASDSAAVSIASGSAKPALNPTSVSFGNVALGSSKAQNVTLANSGAATLTGISVSIGGTNAGDYSQANNCGASLAPGASCAIAITFKPAAAGARSATLSVATAAGPVSASLTGAGVTAAAPSLTPSSLNFGTVTIGVASATQELTLANPSSTPLTGIRVSLSGPNGADFGGMTNCQSTLAAGATCTVNLFFKPSVGGAGAATLTAVTSGGTLTSALTGTGATATTTAAYSLQAPATATAGGSMVVNWTAPAGHASNDFIGLYSTAGGYWFQPVGSATSGSFTVPVPRVPGTYFFRYVLVNVWTIGAQSSNIVVK